jgi:hypothetical protein
MIRDPIMTTVYTLRFSGAPAKRSREPTISDEKESHAPTATTKGTIAMTTGQNT